MAFNQKALEHRDAKRVESGRNSKMTRDSASEVNFSGRWQLDLTRSHFVGPAPRELVMTVRHDGDVLEQDVSGVRQDGSPLSALFVTRTSGLEGTTFLDGKELAGRAYWVGRDLIVEARVDGPNGCVIYRDYWTLDSNADILTTEHRDDPLAGTRSVYSRANDGAV